MVKIGRVVFELAYASGQTDRRTDIGLLITIIRTLPRGEVILFDISCSSICGACSLNSTGSVSSYHPHSILVTSSSTCLERMPRGCRACWATSPFRLLRAYLIGRPTVYCGILLPVCPCFMSFSKFNEPDTRDLVSLLLRTSRLHPSSSDTPDFLVTC